MANPDQYSLETYFVGGLELVDGIGDKGALEGSYEVKPCRMRILNEKMSKARDSMRVKAHSRGELNRLRTQFCVTMS